MFNHYEHEPGEEGRRHGRKVVRIMALVLAGIGAAVLFAAVFGFLVEVLWNWVMPPIFGLKTITFWQGFGILLLAKLLFGGFGPGHRRHSERWGRRFRERVHGVEPEAQGGPEEAPMPGDSDRWPLFRQFWREEGRAAFDAYVQKKKSRGEK